MSYLVSQMRKNSGQTYMRKLNIKVLQDGRYSIDPFGQDRTFKDYAIELANSQSFITGKTYYLRFKIARIPQYYYSSNNTDEEYKPVYQQADTLNLTVLLTNNKTEEEGQTTQTVGTCSIPKVPDNTEDANYSTFSFVFTPIQNFNYLVFKIQRNTYDAIEHSVDETEGELMGKSGRTWLIDSIPEENITPGEEDDKVIRNRGTNGTQDFVTLTIPKQRIFVDYSAQDANNLNTVLSKGQLCELVNMVSTTEVNSQSKADKWLKLGFQSRPGSLIVVNQQPIRVGRSGIFELNNGMEIKQFMLATPGGAVNNGANIDAFLLDYAYQTTQGQQGG